MNVKYPFVSSLSFQLFYPVLESLCCQWIAGAMSACCAINFQKWYLNFFILMQYESFLHEWKHIVTCSNINWNVDLNILNVVRLICCIYFDQDHYSNHYFHFFLDFSSFKHNFEVNFVNYQCLNWFLILHNIINCI